MRTRASPVPALSGDAPATASAAVGFISESTIFVRSTCLDGAQQITEIEKQIIIYRGDLASLTTKPTETPKTEAESPFTRNMKCAIGRKGSANAGRGRGCDKVQ
jgi:hypothetical protein